MNMACTVHFIMGKVVQQSEAPGLHVSPCNTLEAKIVHQSEAPDYMIDDTHSKTNDKYSTHSKAVRFLMYMMTYTVQMMANVVHESSLGKGT